jgi:transcriptional regulator with XRE-family HTH domain
MPDGLPSTSTGIDSLDRLLDGGLVPGDNVVVPADPSAPLARFTLAFAMADPSRTAWVSFAGAPESVDPRIEVHAISADAAREDPATAVAAILAIAADRPRLVIDGLGEVRSDDGDDSAVELYRRCCPQLFDRAAIAWWPMLRSDLEVASATRIQRIAQCVIELREGEVRVAKAEGRPARVQGALGELDPDDGTGLPVVGRDKAAGRLGEGLKRLRRTRNLSQRQLAEAAGVTAAAISQAESGRRGLSLDTLVTLGDELGIGIDELLGTGLEDRPTLVRRDRRSAGHGIATLFDAPESVTVHRVELAPGTTGRPPFAHKGPEVLLVARGLVLVDLGDDSPVVRAGDALRVPRDPIGSWTNLGEETAELFWLAEP